MRNDVKWKVVMRMKKRMARWLRFLARHAERAAFKLEGPHVLWMVPPLHPSCRCCDLLDAEDE